MFPLHFKSCTFHIKKRCLHGNMPFKVNGFSQQIMKALIESNTSELLQHLVHPLFLTVVYILLGMLTTNLEQKLVGIWFYPWKIRNRSTSNNPGDQSSALSICFRSGYIFSVGFSWGFWEGCSRTSYPLDLSYPETIWRCFGALVMINNQTLAYHIQWLHREWL